MSNDAELDQQREGVGERQEEVDEVVVAARAGRARSTMSSTER